MLRLPSYICLPFGYRVTVKQMTNAEFDSHATDADALWLDHAKTILIRKSLSPKRKAYLLAHELGHAWLDWQHTYLDLGEAKP